MTLYPLSSSIESMNIAKQINQKLDEINKFKSEMKKMNSEIKEDQIITNIQTGEKTDKQGAFRVVEGMIDQIKEEINKLSNNGENVKDIFTNKFYVNDHMQDKICAEEEMDNVLNNKEPNNIELN